MCGKQLILIHQNSEPFMRTISRNTRLISKCICVCSLSGKFPDGCQKLTFLTSISISLDGYFPWWFLHVFYQYTASQEPIMQERDVRQDLTISHKNWKCIGAEAQPTACSRDGDAKARITDVCASHVQRGVEGPGSPTDVFAWERFVLSQPLSICVRAYSHMQETG